MRFYKRSDSPCWWVEWRESDGKIVRQSTYAKTKSAARAWLAQHQRGRLTQQQQQQNEVCIVQSANVQPVPSQSHVCLWDDAVVRWCALTEHKATQHDDLSKFRWLHPYWAGKVLAEITAAQIVDIAAIKAKETSRSTANRYLALIRSVLRQAALDWEWIVKVPRIRLYPEPKHRVCFLTEAQAIALLDLLPEYLQAMMRFTLATGLRQGNVFGLRWDQVDLDKRKAWIHPDQAKAREAIGVPLNELALSVLRAQQGKHPEAVFTNKGRPVRQLNRQIWKKAVAVVGLRGFRWHDLRHTWASWLLMKGATLAELQELGGWQTVSMVQRYAHLSTEHLLNVSSRLDGSLGNRGEGEQLTTVRI